MKRPIKILEYETAAQPLIPARAFFRRLGVNIAIAMVLVGVSLAIGMIGYHATAGLGWLDAFLNASMILSGMGPVDTLTAPAAKLFAGIFALYSGLMLIATATLVFAPVLHRLMHRLHVQDDGEGK